MTSYLFSLFLAASLTMAASAELRAGMSILDLPQLGSTALVIQPDISGQHVFVMTRERLLLRLNAADLTVNASVLLDDFSDCDSFYFTLEVVSDTFVRTWCSAINKNEPRYIAAISVMANATHLAHSGLYAYKHVLTALNVNLGSAVVRDVVRDSIRQLVYLLYVETGNACASGVIVLNDAEPGRSGIPALQHLRLQQGIPYTASSGLPMCNDPAVSGGVAAPLARFMEPYGASLALDPLRRRLYIGGQQRVITLQLDPLAVVHSYIRPPSEYSSSLVRFDQVALSPDAGIFWSAMQFYSGLVYGLAHNSSGIAQLYHYFTVRQSTTGSYRPLVMTHCAACGTLVFADTGEIVVVDLTQTDSRAGSPRGPAVLQLPLNTSSVAPELLWPREMALVGRLNADGSIIFVLYRAKPNVIYAISTVTGAVLAVTKPFVGAALTENGVASTRGNYDFATGTFATRTVMQVLAATHPDVSYSPATGRLAVVSYSRFASLLLADFSGSGIALPWPPALIETAVPYASIVSTLAGASADKLVLAGNGAAYAVGLRPVLARRTGAASLHEFLVGVGGVTFSASTRRLLADESVAGPVLLLMLGASFSSAAQVIRWNDTTGVEIDRVALPASTVGLDWAAAVVDPRSGILYGVLTLQFDAVGASIVALDARARPGSLNGTMRVSVLDRDFTYISVISLAVDPEPAPQVVDAAGRGVAGDARLLMGALHATAGLFKTAAVFVVNCTAIGTPILQLLDRNASLGVESVSLASMPPLQPAAAVQLSVSSLKKRPYGSTSYFEDATYFDVALGDACEAANKAYAQSFALDMLLGHVYVVVMWEFKDFACLVKLSRGSLALLGTSRLPLSTAAVGFGLVQGGIDETRRHLVLVAGAQRVSLLRVGIDPLQPLLMSAQPLVEASAGSGSLAGLLLPSAGWSCPPAASAANASCVFAGGAVQVTGQLFGVVPSMGELIIALKRVTGRDCTDVLTGAGAASASAAWGCTASSPVSPLRSIRRAASQLLNASAIAADPVTGSVLPPADATRDTPAAAVPVWSSVADGVCPDEPPASISCIPASVTNAYAGPNATGVIINTVTCLLDWPGAASHSRCLRGTLYRLTASLRGQSLQLNSSAGSLFAVIDGGPAIAAVAPAVITTHGQALTLEIVSPTVLNVSKSLVALLFEADAAVAAAAISSRIAAGQSALVAARAALPATALCGGLTAASSTSRLLLQCTAPPLHASLINTPLAALLVGLGTASTTAPLVWAASIFQSLNTSTVALGGDCAARTSNLPACSSQPLVSVLPLAVLYPAPVLASVSPSTPITSSAGVTVTSDAFAVSDTPSPASSPQLRVWIDGRECTGVRYAGASSRGIECSAPAGGGASLPVVVEVTNPASGATFNVTSRAVAATAWSPLARFGAASFYSASSGSLLDVAVAASALSGAGSDRLSYRAPTLRTSQPQTLQLLPGDCAPSQASSSARLLNISIAVLDAPPADQAKMLVAGVECTSTRCRSCDTIGAGTAECTCTCVANASALCPAGATLRGGLLLPISLVVSPWNQLGRELSQAVLQADRTLRVFLADAVMLAGAPILTSITPSRGGAGTVIEAIGGAFGSSAADLVAVYVGGSPAHNITWRSFTSVLFAAPPLDARAAGGAAARVQVVTAGGASIETVSFTYPEVFTLSWGSAAVSSAAADLASARVSMTGPSAASDACVAAAIALPASATQRFSLQPALSIEAAFGRPLGCSLGLMTLDAALAARAGPSSSQLVQSISIVGSVTASESVACRVSLVNAAAVRPAASTAGAGNGSYVQVYVASFAAASVSVECDGMPANALPPVRLAFAVTGSCDDAAGVTAASLPPFLLAIPSIRASWAAESVLAVASAPLLPLSQDDRRMRGVMMVDPWPGAALTAVLVSPAGGATNVSAGVEVVQATLPALASLLSCTARLRISTSAVSTGATSQLTQDDSLTIASAAAASMRLLSAGTEVCPTNASVSVSGLEMSPVFARVRVGRTGISKSAAVSVALDFPWLAFSKDESGSGTGTGTAELFKRATQRALAMALMLGEDAPTPAVTQAFDGASVLPAELAAACSWTSGGTALNVSLPAPSFAAATSLNAAASAASGGTVDTRGWSNNASSIRVAVALPHVLWSLRPPSQVESQALVAPPPSVALLLPAALPQQTTALATNATSCTLSAAVVPPLSAQSALTSPAASASSSRGRIASSLVVPQTVTAATADSVAQIVLSEASAAIPLMRPASALVFDSVLIAGYRESSVAYTARCSFGGIELPSLTSSASISGCPVGSAPAGDSGWVCSVCSSGLWSRGGAMSCTGCPRVGASCAAGVLTLHAGYYVDIARTAAAASVSGNITRLRRLQQSAASGSVESLAATGAAVVARTGSGIAVVIDDGIHLVACVNPAACTLNTSAMSSTGAVQYGCAPGYSGSLCGTCDSSAGYVLTDALGAVCAQCDKPAASVLIIIVFVLLALVAIVWLALRSVAPEPQPAASSQAAASTPGTSVASNKRIFPSSAAGSAATSFRMLTTHVQTLNALTLLRTGSADVLQRVLAWSAVAAANPSAFPAVACAIPLSYASRLTTLLLLPLCLIASAALLRGLLAVARRRKSTSNRGSSCVCKLRLCCSHDHSITSASASSSARARAGKAKEDKETYLTVSPLAALPAMVQLHRSAVQASPSQSRRMFSSASASVPAARQATPLLWWLINSAVLLASFAYMPLVQASIAALDCLSDTVDGARLLRADLSVRCGSSSHAPAAALAVAVLVLVGLGLPLLIAVLILAIVQPAIGISKSKPAVRTAVGRAAASACLSCCSAWLRRMLPPPHVFASLYGDYAVERGRGWFEAAVLARKSALALAMQLLATPGEQALAACVVLLLALLCSMWAWPYNRERSNALEIAQLGALALSAVLSLTFALPGAGTAAAEAREAGAAAVILLVNVLTLAAVVADACSVGRLRSSVTVAAQKIASARAKPGLLRQRLKSRSRPLTSSVATASTGTRATVVAAESTSEAAAAVAAAPVALIATARAAPPSGAAEAGNAAGTGTGGGSGSDHPGRRILAHSFAPTAIRAAAPPRSLAAACLLPSERRLPPVVAAAPRSVFATAPVRVPAAQGSKEE